MFEISEYINFSKQFNETIKGKTIQSGSLGNSPHKFVWYNRSESEFADLTKGKVVGETRAKGRWLSVSLAPGFILLFGECGGKLLYHQPGAKFPKKYHLSLTFEDDSFLTATTQMWGAMELYEEGEEQNREYIKDMKPTPVEQEFTLDYFTSLVSTVAAGKKRSVKSLLTQDQIIPGLGNAIAQDIMFLARLHPKHPIDDLNAEQRRGLYNAIQSTVHEIIEKGGRCDEFDLFNERGGYVRLMDKNTVGHPCPNCGSAVEKMSYLGGTCYFCPECQI